MIPCTGRDPVKEKEASALLQLFQLYSAILHSHIVAAQTYGEAYKLYSPVCFEEDSRQYAVGTPTIHRRQF